MNINKAGQRVRRYRKAIIKTGRYVDASQGIDFEVTPTSLSHWVKTFAEMKANGVQIPTPASYVAWRCLRMRFF